MTTKEFPTETPFSEEKAVEIIHTATRRLVIELILVEAYMNKNGFQGVSDPETRGGLSSMAVQLAAWAMEVCFKLDYARALQEKMPVLLPALRMAEDTYNQNGFLQHSRLEPSFFKALDQRIGAEMSPLLNAAKRGNASMTFAQIDRAIARWGGVKGLEGTTTIRTQLDLRSNPDFLRKMGRKKNLDDPKPEHFIPMGEYEIVLHYWLPLQLWKCSDSEAHTKIEEASQLLGHAVPKWSAKKNAGFQRAFRTALSRLIPFSVKSER